MVRTDSAVELLQVKKRFPQKKIQLEFGQMEELSELFYQAYIVRYQNIWYSRLFNVFVGEKVREVMDNHS